MIEILSCPHCNSPADISFGTSFSAIQCNNCKMRGPASSDINTAISLWNSLPRHIIQWIDTPPSSDGSYWYSPPDENPIVLEIEDSLVRDGRLLIPVSLLPGRWSSKIPLPLDIK